MRYKVLGIQDSIYEIESTILSVWMKMTVNDMPLEFSSEKSDESDIFSTVLKSMTHRPIEIFLSKKGRVMRVVKLESVWAGMFDKFPELPQAKRDQIKSQLMQAYGEKAIKGNIEMTTAIFPDHPVKKGDKWHADIPLEAGFAGIMQLTFELKDVAESHYLISGMGRTHTANKDAYVTTNGMPMKFDLDGPTTSVIKVSRNTCWTIESKLDFKIKGTVHIKDNPRMPGGAVIPMSMEGSTNVSSK